MRLNLSFTVLASISVLLSLPISSLSYASESLSYVDGSKPFIEIEDEYRQAEVWAVCSASYETMGSIFKSKPVMSKRMKELANGSEMAVGMTLVTHKLSSDITPERFNAIWTYAKVAMEEWPKTQLTGILLEAEELGAEGSEKFLNKIVATVKICMSNLNHQQKYIDTWRDLVMSGLLKLPENK